MQSALFHPSYRNETHQSLPYDFDRLEFFGDSILNYVICCKIYKTFPDADEGLLSRLRSILVSRKMLARIAQQMRFHRILKLGKDLQSQPSHFKEKVFADGLEALLAAIFLEQGLAKTEKFILKHFEPYININRLFRINPNPKSTLQEMTQKLWQKLPFYTNKVIGDKCQVTVCVGRDRKATATGRTRREAEEKAARTLIKKIRQEEAKSRFKARSSGKKSRKIL